MQICNGVRRAGATVVVLWAAQTMGATALASAVELPSPEAQVQMLQVLEARALYRDRVDWAGVRATLAAATDDADRRRLLDDAATRSTGGHGRWIPPSLQRQRSGLAQRLKAGQDAALPMPWQADARVGVLQVSPFLDDPQAGEQARYDARRTYALALQHRIVALDDGTRCGWVVDLSGNGGGNMWPMLLGLLPLLQGTPDKEGAVIGGFRSAEGQRPWRQRDGEVLDGANSRLRSRQAAYVLRGGSAPVAVVFGPRTASSGEAVALAFRGQPGSRSFGQPSAGYSTGNQPVPLVDGSMLLLTVNIMTDRQGQGDGRQLQPDQPTAPGASGLQAAQDWLLAQPACSGR